MFSVPTDRPAGAELSSMIDEICRTGALVRRHHLDRAS
jgi:hypothetical protein